MVCHFSTKRVFEDSGEGFIDSTSSVNHRLCAIVSFFFSLLTFFLQEPFLGNFVLRKWIYGHDNFFWGIIYSIEDRSPLYFSGVSLLLVWLGSIYSTLDTSWIFSSRSCMSNCCGNCCLPFAVLVFCKIGYILNIKPFTVYRGSILNGCLTTVLITIAQKEMDVHCHHESTNLLILTAH